MIFAEKLNTIAENMVHLQNVTKKWFDRGRDYEQQEFWNVFQQNGARQNYEHGFAGKGWYNENLKPKYDITPSYASNMFLNTEYKGDLRDLPVKLDFSKSSSMSNLLGYAYGITGIGVVDTRMTANPLAIFTYARALQTVEKLILKSDGSQSLNNAFTQCYELRDIVIEGTIGQTVDFQHSTKLSKASITSIINALSSSVSGKSVSLSKDAVIEAFRNGVNLLSKPYIDSAKVVNGITFTDNGDGTITANGTATADATFSVKVFQTTPNGSFALVGCPVGGSASTYYIAYEGYGRDYGKGVMWDGSRDFWDTVIIVIKKGTKVSNLKFAPQINNINEWNALVATKSDWTINLL